MSARQDFVWDTSRYLADVRGWVHSSLAPALREWDFESMAPLTSAVFVRRRSFWPMALISPLAFLVSPYQRDQSVVSFVAAGPVATRMTVVGELPRRIVDVLERLPQVIMTAGDAEPGQSQRGSRP